MTEQSGSPHNRVVVGIDGSETSRLALQWAVHLAAVSGASVDAVIAWERPVEVGWTEGWSYQPVPGDTHEQAERVLAETVAEVYGPNPPAGLRQIVVEGNPANVLLQCSADAVALVVGSTGRGGVAALVLGSTSVRCAERASCPVLVVHGDRPPPAGGSS